MGEQTGIEFCNHTLNPWWGCTKVHEGCANCYAEGQVKRFDKSNWGPHGTRRMIKGFRKEAIKLNRKAGEAGERRRVLVSMCDPFEEFEGPIVDSNGELVTKCEVCGVVHSDNPICKCEEMHFCSDVDLNDMRRNFFEVIDETPNLDWLLFTKRPENIRRMWPALSDGMTAREWGKKNKPRGINAGTGRPNVWLVTSVSNQDHADEMVPELLKCRDLAPVLGVSYEPALGPIDFTGLQIIDDTSFNSLTGEMLNDCGDLWEPRDLSSLDWIVAGGESGPKARPSHPDWYRSVRDQCLDSNVPFFFKQWGEWLPWEMSGSEPLIQSQNGLLEDSHVIIPPDLSEGNPLWDDGLCFIDSDVSHAIFEKIGKKRSGRMLDGEEFSGFPDRPPIHKLIGGVA